MIPRKMHLTWRISRFYPPSNRCVLLLSHACSATPWTSAFQPSLSIGFPRQESWRELPFPAPMWAENIAPHSAPAPQDLICPTEQGGCEVSFPASSQPGPQDGPHGCIWPFILLPASGVGQAWLAHCLSRKMRGLGI